MSRRAHLIEELFLEWLLFEVRTATFSVKIFAIASGFVRPSGLRLFETVLVLVVSMSCRCERLARRREGEEEEEEDREEVYQWAARRCKQRRVTQFAGAHVNSIEARRADKIAACRRDSMASCRFLAGRPQRKGEEY